MCGNGGLDIGEDCDDGNREPLDGCSSICTDEVGTPPVLLGRWDFEELGGSTVLDSSGNALHGTIEGLAQREPGPRGNSLLLDGATRVNLGDPPLLDITGPFTVMAWVRRNELANASEYANVLARGHTPTASGTGVYVRLIGFNVEGGRWAGNNDTAGTFCSSMQAWSVWIHVAVVMKDSPASSWAIYLNGQNCNRQLGQAPVDVAAGWALGARGGSYTADMRYLFGGLDDVRIYGEALTDEQVSAVYNAP